ncbi:hypothetical protein [Psychrobacter urativorans]|uniref:hypothetical protein n=1 Tax=Psychrobacter urativorans TaxID=45610 RepID=UPI00191899BE|nr:hypothetical protein [Psychrobacter urativorans]
MEIKVREADDVQLDIDAQSIVILPYNYEANKNYTYNSTSISFYKYAKSKLDIKYFTEPELLVEQRSGDWFAPVLFVSSVAMTQNPELITIALSVIANYVTDFFKGKDSPNIRLKVVHKETKTSKLTEIYYEGGLDGLSQLEASINKIANKGTSDE